MIRTGDSGPEIFETQLPGVLINL